MQHEQLVEQLTARIAIHESEASAFTQEMERGGDLFGSECGRKYHDGCADALKETLDLLSVLYIPNDEDFTDAVAATTPV